MGGGGGADLGHALPDLPLVSKDMVLQATYSALRLYIYCQYVCSLGIEPMTFCAANTMLYH